MSYTILLKIYNETSTVLSIVEKAGMTNATWSEIGVDNRLNMVDSGTSGMIRLQSPSGENITLALGYHNYKAWCDIQVDVGPGNTTVKLLPEYYGGRSLASSFGPSCAKTTKSGKHVSLEFREVREKSVVAIFRYHY